MEDPIQHGQEMMLCGNYHEAQDIFLRILHDDPQNDTALYHLGLCHLAFDNLMEAENCLRQCLEVNPRHVDALIDLGEIEFSKGDPEQAMLSFGMAMTIQEENPRSYVSLARVQDYLGMYHESVDNYEKAMVLSDPLEAPTYDLAIAYTKVGRFLRADLILEGLITDTLRRGSISLVGEVSEAAREDMSDFIQEMRQDRENIQEMFYEQKGFSIDTARCMYQALLVAREHVHEDLAKIVSEVRVLRYMGMEVENRRSSYRLRNLDGVFSGHQLLCFEFAFSRLLKQAQELPDDLGAAFTEAEEVLTGK